MTETVREDSWTSLLSEMDIVASGRSQRSRINLAARGGYAARLQKVRDPWWRTDCCRRCYSAGGGCEAGLSEVPTRLSPLDTGLALPPSPGGSDRDTDALSAKDCSLRLS